MRGWVQIALLLVGGGASALEVGEAPVVAGGQQITLPGPVFPIFADAVPEHHLPASPQAISSSDVTFVTETPSTLEASDVATATPPVPVVPTVAAVQASAEAVQTPVAAAPAAPAQGSDNLFARLPTLTQSGTRPAAPSGTRPAPTPQYGYQPMQTTGGYFPQETAPFGYPHGSIPELQNPFKGTNFEQVPFPMNPMGFPYLGTPMGLAGAFGAGTMPMMF